MINLTRLNGQSFILNSDLIRTIEATPDTVISLTLGEKMMVKEDVKTVIDSVLEYRRKIAQGSIERES